VELSNFYLLNFVNSFIKCNIELYMKYCEIEKLIKAGKTGLLPNYVGYFKWDYAT